MTNQPTVGFVGLGNMGSALASNLVAAGHQIVAYDSAGPTRAPDGADPAADVADVARRADVVVCSLPDGAASASVAAELSAALDRRARLVIDTSTIGVDAAQRTAALLASDGVAYVDAPVSGGVAGARARTLLVMYAADDDTCARAEPVLAGMTDRHRRVGDRPGLAQALKLANNFLAAVTLTATSEAIVFGTSVGLEMATMLDVLNASSGQSGATSDKFPRHVLTGTYAAGFSNSLMAKDLALYLDAVGAHGAPDALGGVTSDVWRRFTEEQPGADFTRIFPYVQQHREP